MHAKSRMLDVGASVKQRLWVKERQTERVQAKVVSQTDRRTLEKIVKAFVNQDATVFTDEAKAYQHLKNHHAVRHSTGEYVRNHIHTNGTQSFWAMFKRGLYGTYHRMSIKHLQRYVVEFVKRNNIRENDTLEQMETLVRGMTGRRLTYQTLIS